jgi:predicted Zn-dependent protease
MEALAYFRQAVKLDPNNPHVLTYLAQMLASDENPKLRDGNAALAMAAKANDLTGGNQPAMLDALAMAYAEIGQFTNALQTAAYAVKLAAAYDMTNDAVLIQQRLQFYQDRRPFRQSFTNAPAKEARKN